MFDLHGYFSSILHGFWITCSVALISLLIAVSIGVVGAFASLSLSRSIRMLALIYSSLVRGVPDLVLMTLIFFGGQIVINELSDWMQWGYVDINPFVAGVVTLGVIFGAYMQETFRGAVQAVPRAEIDAGFAFGMSAWQVFTRIILPVSLRHALPGFTNNWLVLLKATALVSVIGLHDMVFNAAQAGGAVREPFTFYFVVAVLFLILTSVSQFALARVGRVLDAGVRRL